MKTLPEFSSLENEAYTGLGGSSTLGPRDLRPMIVCYVPQTVLDTKATMEAKQTFGPAFVELA